MPQAALANWVNSMHFRVGGACRGKTLRIGLGLLPTRTTGRKDFPFFMDDLRPQGFIGRLLARQHSQPLALPIDPTSWSDDDTLHFLLAAGHDGRKALAAIQRNCDPSRRN